VQFKSHVRTGFVPLISCHSPQYKKINIFWISVKLVSVDVCASEAMYRKQIFTTVVIWGNPGSIPLIKFLLRAKQMSLEVYPSL
jgi:hypothetical protein